MVDSCLLQLQKIPTKRGWANVLWDSGASLCFITNSKAKAERLKGTKVELTVIKVGGDNEKISSNRYTLSLIDKQGQEVQFEVYGIDKITSDIQSVNVDGIIQLFKNVSKEEISRPSGTIDVLIGYEYAAYHPQNEQTSGHLLLLKNRFGRCIGGTHPFVKETTKNHMLDHINVNTAIVRVEDFYNIENLGIGCTPRCGGCKCGKCSLGTQDYTIKEEKELHLIESKLEYNKDEKRWIAEYPWIRDPAELPNNKGAAMGMLISTEKRLAKNEEHAKVYQKQIEDMIEREVARKLSQTELDNYKGPIHYISHHEVLKPDSKSTPVRIVFNSSARYMGHMLNDYWAKGPHLLNDLLGVLIRFRENNIAMIGDIKKMYHTVKIKTLEQHTHRFLWRDMDTKRPPDTYVIQRVSFGDKPSGTIATVALRKTAEMGTDKYPKAAQVIKENTYMDDIIESVPTKEKATKLAKDIEALLDKGNFKMKEWIFTHDRTDLLKTIPNDKSCTTEKVLGVVWNPVQDEFVYKMHLRTTSKKTRNGKTHDNANNPTKRIILSQVNSIYDPLGLAGPFTVRAKILMRELWGIENKLGWDDALPERYEQHWKQFCQDMLEMNNVKFKRCVKPKDAADEKPILIIFSDGSSNAFGACAYARWKLNNGRYSCRLILSKNRLAPIKRMSIDRIELCGALLNSRLKTFLLKQCRYKFIKCYHIVDSQIVHSMIQKESYGFNTFAATRVGEIQQNTNPKEWFWMESKYNIADWLTRGKKPTEINLDSIWQNGPSFLELPESEWPIHETLTKEQLPELIKIASTVTKHFKKDDKNTLASKINIGRYSDFGKLIRVTARILAMYQRKPKPSFKHAAKSLTPSDITNAENFWITEAQKSMYEDIEKGIYKRLCPRKNTDGIYVVGGRGERWIEMSHNKNEVILLPYDHRFSRLYAEHIHRRGHLGVLSTASKIRARFWIVKLLKMVKFIRYNCVICKKLDKRVSEQIMGKLPVERLKPSPAWTCTAIDLFGPFKIRDEVKKRTTGKTYGVIFNCLGTRAVHIDLAADYSTEKFLMVLRRFASIRGYPSKLYSDNGPQLVAANEELKNVVKGWNEEELKEFGVMEGFKWDFAPADAPWQNGVSEALVKSVKRALTAAISDHVMTFSELQTVCFEVANLVNERPIGRHPTSPDDGTYLCPNDLLLGRATSRVPSGPFRETSNPRQRFEFVQNVVNYFWKKWTRDFFPSLLIQPKWHTARRNLREGDVVLIQDANQIRGQWKLGIVVKTFPGEDGRVRRVQVQYKNPKPGEAVNEYHGRGFVTVERAVNKLVVLIPNEET